jgi:hypothetical protein
MTGRIFFSVSTVPFDCSEWLLVGIIQVLLSSWFSQLSRPGDFVLHIAKTLAALDCTIPFGILGHGELVCLNILIIFPGFLAVFYLLLCFLFQISFLQEFR